MSRLLVFLIKSGSRIPDSTGRCVSLVFVGSISFIGVSVNAGLEVIFLEPGSALGSSSGPSSLYLGFGKSGI